MNQRDPYFDNLKFMLIVLVVVGHIIEPLIYIPVFKSIYAFIYSFHMPLFVFISGYFAKNIDDPKYEIKIISKLVIPYVIFEMIYSVFDFWIFHKESLHFTFFTPYWMMWFLFSMIIWKAALPYVVRIRYALPVTFLFGLIAGYTGELGYYASLSRIVVFFPFFLAGFYFEKKHLEKLLTRNWRFAAVCVMLLAFLTFCYFGQNYTVSWFYGSASYQALGATEWYAGFYRAGIYLLAVVLGLGVMLLVPGRQIPLVSALGRNTMYTYLLHGLIVKALVAYGFYQILQTGPQRALVIILGAALAIILALNGIRTLFKWMVEPKVSFLFKENSKQNI
ncbi:MAG: acyltransferase family protein [Dehalobacter sp.]|nr:acyltransferase family protein [Dehalobacter sp.]